MPNSAIFFDNTRIFHIKVSTFAKKSPKNMSKNKGINRIKVVLAEQLDKGEATISKWCTNRVQPSLETLVQIANVLQVDVKDLLRSTIQDSDMV